MAAPKIRVRASVPREMRSGFREIVQLLKHKRREGEPIDHGDALQSSALCGGRTGTEPRPFEFTYYGPAGSHWYLQFAKIQLRDIAQGHLREILLYKCDRDDCQDHFATPDAVCARCDLPREA